MTSATTPVTGPHEPRVFHVYDTTLRDGAQQEGMNLSVADKLAIAPLLDELGVGFIEGGWPGAVPKDTEFFRRAAKELDLRRAVLAAFGATRKAGLRAWDDPQVRALVDSEAPVVTLVAKSDVRHVERALRTTPDEGLAMITDTVSFLVGEGRRVVVDAEHFFDGYRYDAALTRAAVQAAFEAGAAHVQGTVNGYGERTGNVDLLTVVANLELKHGVRTLTGEGLEEATRISHAISEITNISPYARQPYVGASAFAHKAGLHASAIKVDPDLYQHIDPTAVGNDIRMLVSDMAGRASIELKGRELGFDLSGQGDLLTRVTNRVKDDEARGYTYEAADASFELLLREEIAGERPPYFRVESWRTIVERAGSRGTEATAEATVKLHAGGERIVSTGEGNGPVNALDHALRLALGRVYPEIEAFELIDFKVRILDTEQGTDAITRVLIETTDGSTSWSTVGVGPNLIEAAWEALTDSAIYGLVHAGVEPR